MSNPKMYKLYHKNDLFSILSTNQFNAYFIWYNKLIMTINIKHILPAIVYGGTDGAVTTFSVMAGAYGAGLDPRIVLILGVANLLSDGFSMASADYLSEESRTQNLPTRAAALYLSVTTFFSFVLVGFIPIIPFVFAYIFNTKINDMFMSSILLTVGCFVSIGLLRGYILKKNMLHLAGQTLLVGSVSASIAYFVGDFLSKLV